jgi:hypothetical protein
MALTNWLDPQIPSDAIGFSIVQGSEGPKRFILFFDGTSVPEETLSPDFLDIVGEHLPFVDKERRNSFLPMALLMQLRTKLDWQDREIERLKKEETENQELRRILLEYGLDRNRKAQEEAIITENAELQSKLQKESFRDQIDIASVASLQASIIRMTGAIWAFAPVSTALARHTDPHVRDGYESNLSLLTMMQELCETALQTCQHLLDGDK